MAKMFYSMGETMLKLNVDHQGVVKIMGSGKLQKFVDGDRWIFLVSEVDALVASAAASGQPGSQRNSAMDLISVAGTVCPVA